jgi:dihydrolipoamide dehydrogenase
VATNADDGDSRHDRVVIIGGGPGGYEASLVAAQLGADVTVVDSDGLGGSAVLTDCVPSKALIAIADSYGGLSDTAESLGITSAREGQPPIDIVRVNQRVKHLASAQSGDISRRLAAEGVRVITGTGRLQGPGHVIATTGTPGAEQEEDLPADVVLLATGAHPRVLADAVPDGERILDWTQLYELPELPERLVVIGSGVTGAEFAGAYQALGSQVVLVSSREQVLPSEDNDAAGVIERAFTTMGMQVLSRSRAASVERTEEGVLVRLTDGRSVVGTHALLAVGSIANTQHLGLAEAGVRTDEAGFIVVDRVSRTSQRGVYAAGDCTGVSMLASVAAMQGRIAMFHALGDAVQPLSLRSVSRNVFTIPEIATVGVSELEVQEGGLGAVTRMLPLAGNPRAKMLGITEGFVKIIARRGSGTVLGGVVVAPRASEMIHALSLAVKDHLSVDQMASAFTVYPSLSGSTAEAARQLHRAVAERDRIG